MSSTQQSAEPNGFATELAAHERVAARRRVALGEHEVDHGEHRIESLGELARRRNAIRNARVANLAVARTSRCAIVGDGDEKRARDLFGRETADRAQRQRDLRVARERRMAAREDRVAADRPRRRSRRRRRSLDPVSAAGVDVSARSPTRARASRRVRSIARKRAVLIEPRDGLSWHSIARPLLHGNRERVLHRLLGGIEIAEEANERREDRGRTPRDRRRAISARASSVMRAVARIRRGRRLRIGTIGRTSIDPVARRRNALRRSDGLVEILGVDEVVAAELLARFGERAVGRLTLAVANANRRRGRRSAGAGCRPCSARSARGPE